MTPHTETSWRISDSTPLKSIADEHGLDYGDVLRYADSKRIKSYNNDRHEVDATSRILGVALMGGISMQELDTHIMLVSCVCGISNMQDLQMQFHVSEAERMLHSLNALPNDHENFSFLCTEISAELNKAEIILRGLSTGLSYEEKNAFNARIATVRTATKPHLQTNKKIQQKFRQDEEDREHRRRNRKSYW